MQFVGMLPLHEARRIENRTSGEVVAIDGAGRTVVVRTHEQTPREVRVNIDLYKGLDLHYAMHVHTGQGATVDRTYVVLGGWQTHKESMYVACSRARHGTRIFIDRESLGRLDNAAAIEEAARRGGRSRAKLAAISYRHPVPTRPSGTRRGHKPRRWVRRKDHHRARRRRPLRVRSQRRQRIVETLAEQRLVRQAQHILLGLTPGVGGTAAPELTASVTAAVSAVTETPHGR